MSAQNSSPQPELWSAAEVAAFHGGNTSPATARKTLSLWGITAVTYKLNANGRPEARYDAVEVRAAYAARPGRGARTDLAERAPKPNYVGLRFYTKAHTTGTHVGVYDGIEADMDTTAGRWQTVCEEHGSIISHETLELARRHAPHPEEWCEYCNGSRPFEFS